MYRGKRNTPRRLKRDSHGATHHPSSSSSNNPTYGGVQHLVSSPQTPQRAFSSSKATASVSRNTLAVSHTHHGGVGISARKLLVSHISDKPRWFSSIASGDEPPSPPKTRKRKGSIVRPRPTQVDDTITDPFLISSPSHTSFSDSDTIEVTTHLSGKNPSLTDISHAIAATLNKAVPTHLERDDMIQISLPELGRLIPQVTGEHIPTKKQTSSSSTSLSSTSTSSTSTSSSSTSASTKTNTTGIPLRPPVFLTRNPLDDSDSDIPPFLRKYKELSPVINASSASSASTSTSTAKKWEDTPAQLGSDSTPSSQEQSQHQPSLQEQAQQRFSKLSALHIVAYLDLHVIAQQEAKQSLAIAVRNRERRYRLSSMGKPKSIQSIEEIGLRIAQQHGYRVSEDLAGTIGKPLLADLSLTSAGGDGESVETTTGKKKTKTKATKSAKSKAKDASSLPTTTTTTTMASHTLDLDGEEYSSFNPPPRRVEDIIKQFGLHNPAYASTKETQEHVLSTIEQLNSKISSQASSFGDNMINEISPFNILMVGPTGSGKTELVKRLCNYLDSPYTQADATRYTETGVVGSDIDSIIGDLYKDALNREKKLELQRLQPRGRRRAVQSLVTAIKNMNDWNAVFDALDKKGLTALYTSLDPQVPSSAPTDTSPSPASSEGATTANSTPSFYMGDFGMNKQPASVATKSNLPILTMDKDGFKPQDIESLIRSGAISQTDHDLTFLVTTSSTQSTQDDKAKTPKKSTKKSSSKKSKQSSEAAATTTTTTVSSDSKEVDEASTTTTTTDTPSSSDAVIKATIKTITPHDSSTAVSASEEPEYLGRGPVYPVSPSDFFDKELNDASTTYNSLVKQSQQQITKFIPSHSELTEWIDKGYLDDVVLEVELPQRSAPSPPSQLDFGMIFATIDSAGPGGSKSRRNVKTVKQTVSVKSALATLTEHEASMFIDEATISERAISNAERNGVVFIDEVDKLIPVSSHEVRSSTSSQKGEGVQRELLSLLQGKTCNVQGVQIKTDGILFICAGAFHHAQPSQLLPELQGRLPVVTKLQPLTKVQMALVLTLPIYSVLKQYVSLMRGDGVDVRITDDAIWEIAQSAYDLNERSLNLGARRLNNIVNSVFGHISYHYANGLKFDVDEITGKITPIPHHSTPSTAVQENQSDSNNTTSGNRRHNATNNTLRTNIPIKNENITVQPNGEVRIVVDADYVRATLSHMMRDIDISKYLL